MNKKVILTGGLGYIGSHTAVELINNGYEPIIIDNLSNSNEIILDGIEKITNTKVLLERIDCKDFLSLKNVFIKYKNIVGVIHFAASKYVGESIANPLLYYENNILSLVNILKCMKEFSINNIVFSSSCTVYGQPKILPVTEKSKIQNPTSPYGNTKQICEEIISDYSKTNENFKYVILRYFNPIGAHESGLIGELPNGVPQNLVPLITQTAYGIREELKIFGNDYNTKDGTCIRDYIHVSDLANSHVKSIDFLLDKKTKSDIFNIGTGKGISVLELVTKFENVNNIELKYSYANKRNGDIEQIWSDSTKANEILGWYPKKTIEQTLNDVWKWENNIRKQMMSYI